MTRARSFRAVIFDLDNTLIDRDGALHDWLSAVVPQSVAAKLTQADDHGNGHRARFLHDLSRELKTTVAQARTAFHAGLLSHIRLMSGAMSVLQALCGKIPVAIGTNGDPWMQREKIRYTDMAKYFQVILISGELGIGKPDPRFFQRAAALLGTNPAETMMVGDHPSIDIAGAHAAGLQTCWVRNNHGVQPATADYTVNKLEEILAL